MPNIPDLEVTTTNSFMQPLVITVDGGTTWIAPDVIEYGQGFNIGFALKNSGTEIAQNVSVRISANNKIIIDKIFNTVNAGGRYWFHYGTYYWEPGEYTIKYILDPDNVIAESDESNNTFTCTLRVEDNGIYLPDLTVNAHQGFTQPVMLLPDNASSWIAPESIDAGIGFDVGFGLKNAGTVNAENVEIQLKVNNAVLVNMTMPSAGHGGWYRYNYGHYAFDPGEYEISLIIDPNNLIAESDESNNIFTYTLSVPGNTNWLMQTSLGGELIPGSNIKLNEYAPIDPATNLRCVPGCVNVAITQILVYFASQGYDFTIELTEDDGFVSNQRITIDGSAENAAANGNLSFAEINEKLKDFDETSADDIAALCYASAVIAQSNYSSHETSTGNRAKNVLMRAGFVTASTASYDMWDANGDLSDKGWNMLINNIQAGKPVYASIPLPSHAIVVDGYDPNNDMVHINYGWGITGGKRYYTEYGLYAGSGWYSRAECNALDLGGFTYDIIPDTTAPVAGEVTCRNSGTSAELTLDFTDDVGVWKKYYRTAADPEWIEYTDAVRITSNTTVYFKACDRAKNYSAETSFTITGIKSAIPENLHGSINGLAWDNVLEANGYTVEISVNNFEQIFQFATETSNVDFWGLPAGQYQWRVCLEGRQTSSAGNEIISQGLVGLHNFISDADGSTDLFFANANGKWSAEYAAQHTGILNGWRGTNEQVNLSGKNKIADVFGGSEDSNILVMTDDVNGDALFVEDIYTSFGKDAARISQIDEIRAGAGDDIVDMTSQRFAYAGSEMTIRGGAGNDVIWATGSDNDLFGDAGDDRIVGSTGFDLIVGGSGNDSMHSGGGNDIFAFCENWGVDTVEITDNAYITLWFTSGSQNNWDAENRIYRDGSNSVTVIGGANSTIDLKFGNAGGQYGDMLDVGAFESAASAKIFEDKNSGMLA